MMAVMSLKKTGVVRLISIQIGVIAGMAGVCGVMRQPLWTSSVVLGGLCFIVPMMVVALLTLRETGAQVVQKIVRRFFISAVVKWLLSGLLFLVVFRWVPLTPAAFFISFVACQLTMWLAPWVLTVEQFP